MGVAQEWEWTAPEDRETKTIVVAVFHWRQTLQKAARANRGQYKQENRAGANRQTEKECERERRREKKRGRATGCTVTVDYFNHAMGLRAKCRR